MIFAVEFLFYNELIIFLRFVYLFKINVMCTTKLVTWFDVNFKISIISFSNNIIQLGLVQLKYLDFIIWPIFLQINCVQTTELRELDLSSKETKLNFKGSNFSPFCDIFRYLSWEPEDMAYGRLRSIGRLGVNQRFYFEGKIIYLLITFISIGYNFVCYRIFINGDS